MRGPSSAPLAKPSSRDWDGRSLCVKYLEHLVFEAGDTKAETHNELLTLYLATVQSLLRAG